jgi:hypothetical protein
LYIHQRKINVTVKIWEKVNLTRGVGKQMKRRKKIKHYKNNKMAEITTYLVILTLNINGLSSPIKDLECQVELKNKA